LLVSPSFGEARENAEGIIEEALEYLNTFREEPGFRFAPYVTARLEIVSDADEARARLESDDALAMMILHDLPDDERIALTLECGQENVPVCRTVPADESQPRPPRTPMREWKVVFGKREDAEEPPAHKVLDTVLTDSLESEEEELVDRVRQLIAVMALGVMEHHWKKNPPRYLFEQGGG
jgi:hypothetical protein